MRPIDMRGGIVSYLSEIELGDLLKNIGKGNMIGNVMEVPYLLYCKVLEIERRGYRISS